MMKKSILAAIAMGFAGISSAATFNFDRGTGSATSFDSYTTYTQSSGGITVSVTGAGDGNKVIRSYAQGLGVGTNLFNYLMSTNESLTFTFNQAVNVAQVVINSYGTGTLTWTGGSISGLTGTTITTPGLNAHFHTVNLTNVTSFTIKSNSNYLMVDGLAGVTAVPVPAAAWFMGSGLLGLAGVARRRRN
jgi:hypothetical protein